MFGFVRPAACRSSAPRSVTDGCPYPPLPRRAKNRNKIQLSSLRKQEISENGLEFFYRCTNSFHRCGGPPPSRREVLGVRRSRPAALPSIAYRGFAVAPITLRAPSRSLLYNSGCRVATLLVSKGVMGFLAKRVYSFHRPRGGPPPSRREVLGVRRSRPSPLPSIGYRGFAVAPITLRAPPIFCKLSIFPSQRPPSSREGDRPQAVEGVSRRWKEYMSHLTPSVTAAPCQTFGVPLACLPHSGRQAPRPQRGSSLVGLFPA